VTILSLRVEGLAVIDGCWRATVYMDGQSRPVDRLYGSWRVTPAPREDGAPPHFQHVTRAVAEELQRLVRKHERANRREPDTEESTTMAATSSTIAAKPAAKRKTPAKAKAKAAAKPAAKKAAAPKPAATKAKTATTRKAPTTGGGPERNAEALKMHEGGKTMREVAEHFGWANPGVAWNAINRARKARDAAKA
jgi:hypothetical protein